jgi:hypothetical protein
MANLLQQMFSTIVGSQHIRIYVRNVFFSSFGTPGIFGIPNGILQKTGTELFNTQKNRDCPGKRGTNGISTVHHKLGAYMCH